MHTIQDYRAKKCTFGEYMGQFVTEATIAMVKHFIGVDRIKNSTDPYMNDIPMKLWDKMPIRNTIDTKFFMRCEWPHYDENKFIFSMANNVCIGKAAAKMIKESVVDEG